MLCFAGDSISGGVPRAQLAIGQGGGEHGQHATNDPLKNQRLSDQEKREMAKYVARKRRIHGWGQHGRMLQGWEEFSITVRTNHRPHSLNSTITAPAAQSEMLGGPLLLQES